MYPYREVHYHKLAWRGGGLSNFHGNYGILLEQILIDAGKV
jgi:hypothetical protein